MSYLEEYMRNFVEFDKMESEFVSFDIKTSKISVDDQKVFDNGLLIAILDTFSSYAGSVLLKNDSISISLSMNLKISSFDEMFYDRTYKMVVWLKNQTGKIIFYEIQILDEDGKLVKLATHLKKAINVTPKF